MSRCHVVYTILRGEPIRVGSLIANSIKRMITATDVYVGHLYVITHLCERLQVPTRGKDDIRGPVDPLGRKFFNKEQRDLQAAAPPPPPPP
ncbi:hypothetical protein A2U01_0069228 [Trifolium medium]|uniref:Uncharacterized protein n=1 Tax=Trifolium medium TaxID=97028 RepID=A0A392SJ55_9FABA|nr:hypothetical protein [Trifolium medium]